MADDEEHEEYTVEMEKVEFANRSDFVDDKLNDVRNFQGLMKHTDYLKRKADLSKEPVNLQEEALKRAKVDNLRKAKDDAALKERMEKKKLALQKELQDTNDDAKGDGATKKASKKEKKDKKSKGQKAPLQLSFDVEEEEEG